MTHTPGLWTWRRPFTGDPEIWVEAVDQNGDDVVVAVLEGGNEADAEMICSSARMRELLCDVLYYVDQAWTAGDQDAAGLAKNIRALLLGVKFGEANF